MKKELELLKKANEKIKEESNRYLRGCIELTDLQTEMSKFIFENCSNEFFQKFTFHFLDKYFEIHGRINGDKI